MEWRGWWKYQHPGVPSNQEKRETAIHGGIAGGVAGQGDTQAADTVRATPPVDARAARARRLLRNKDTNNVAPLGSFDTPVPFCSVRGDTASVVIRQ
eukprot:scaffold183_cov69-Phaeocystis_antarctica.AAC.1